MPITIDHHDIVKALNLYKLEVTDYYLEFDNNHVYMHWVSCPNDIEDYLKNENDICLCLDFQVKGKWLPAEYFVNDKDALTERPFTNCRYLLEIN